MCQPVDRMNSLNRLILATPLFKKKTHLRSILSWAMEPTFARCSQVPVFTRYPKSARSELRTSATCLVANKSSFFAGAATGHHLHLVEHDVKLLEEHLGSVGPLLRDGTPTALDLGVTILLYSTKSRLITDGSSRVLPTRTSRRSLSSTVSSVGITGRQG